MKKIMIILAVSMVAMVSLSCSLSQYLSDSPPAQIETPAPTSTEPSSGFLFTESACFPGNSVPEDFSKIDPEDIDEIPFNQNDIEQALSNVLSDAKLQSFEAFVSIDGEMMINCTEISPLKALEKTAFDFLIENPENFIQYFGDRFSFSRSEIANEISNLGDSRAAYQFDLSQEGLQTQVDIVIFRTEASVYMISFINQSSIQNYSVLLDILNRY